MFGSLGQRSSSSQTLSPGTGLRQERAHLVPSLVRLGRLLTQALGLHPFGRFSQMGSGSVVSLLPPHALQAAAGGRGGWGGAGARSPHVALASPLAQAAKPDPSEGHEGARGWGWGWEVGTGMETNLPTGGRQPSRGGHRRSQAPGRGGAGGGCGVPGGVRPVRPMWLGVESLHILKLEESLRLPSSTGARSQRPDSRGLSPGKRPF